MGPEKIMLIRHAEKPDGTGGILGVDETGKPNPNQLSVRGWQRAGALVRYFAPIGERAPGGIATPTAIFASKPANGSNSVRSISTVLPLAGALQMPAINEIGRGDLPALVKAVASAPGAVLICWSHEEIPAIVQGLAGNEPGFPTAWPRKRFDVVWILDRTNGAWSFSQVAQCLLPQDAPIP